MAETEFNPDEFLAGIRRRRTPVKIYTKPDLADEIAGLEQELEALDVPDEAPMGGGPVRDLNDRIDALAQEFHDSAVTFWIQPLGPDEIEEISKRVRKEHREKADKIAKDAREEAKVSCKRQGITEQREVEKIVRDVASNASNTYLSFETSLHILAAAVVEPKLSPEHLRELNNKLGDGQVRKLNDAFRKVTQGSPEESVPKSSRRGTTAGETSL